MFFEHLVVDNFMIHRHSEISFGEMTVFAGPNNCGKSAVFESLVTLTNLASDSVATAFSTGPHSYRSRHHNGSPEEEPMCLTAKLRTSRASATYLDYSIAFRQTSFRSGTAAYRIEDESLRVGPAGTVIYDRSSGPPAPEVLRDFTSDDCGYIAALRAAFFSPNRFVSNVPEVAACAREIKSFGKYRLNPTLLMKPSQMPTDLLPSEAGGRLPLQHIGYDGDGLPSLLYFLSRTRSQEYDLIVEAVKDAIDGFVDFDFNAIPNGMVGLSFKFDDSRGTVEAPNVSAGTLSLAGWLAVLLRPGRHKVLALEEPEAGLTPRGQRVLFDAMKRVASGNAGPRTQILAATHSPRILEWTHQEPEIANAYVLRTDGGTTTVVPYDEALDGHIERDFNRAMAVDQANQIMDAF